MKRIVLATLCLIFTACNVNPRAESVAFGDSVTWGYGDLPGGWVRRVSQGSGYSIANLGIPGERAADGDQRADIALRTVPAAKVVFLLHGGNDWNHIFSKDGCAQMCDPASVDARYEEVASHLRAMRKTIHNRGKRAVFLTYWPSSPEKCDKYNAQQFAVFKAHRLYLDNKIIAVAAEHGDTVIDLKDLDLGTADDFFDCLHPSPQGYRKIAGRILEHIGEWAPPDPFPRDLLKGRLRL